MKHTYIMCSKKELPDMFGAPLSLCGGFMDIKEWKKNLASTDAIKNSMMIVDCTAISAPKIITLVSDIKRMLDNNQPILVVKPTSKHKLALAKAQILSNYILEDSEALFIEPRRDASGNLRIALAEHFGVICNGNGERTLATFENGTLLDTKTESYQAQQNCDLTIDDITPFINRIRHSLHQLDTDKVLLTTNLSGYVGPTDPPSSVPSELWHNTPVTIYQTIAPAGQPAGSYKPPVGKVTLEGLVSIGVYYDNKKYSTPIQWVFLEHSGHLATQMNFDTPDQRGWSISALYINGENISSPTLTCPHSAPNNVSGERQYTTSSSFGVGLSAGTSGITGDINYSIQSSETCTITEWGLIQHAPNSWDLIQQIPYNGSVVGFPDGSCDRDGAKPIPVISKSTLAFNTQSEWVRNPAVKSESRNVNYKYSVISRFIWCDKHGKKGWHAWSWRYEMPISRTYVIDFSKAFPKK